MKKRMINGIIAFLITIPIVTVQMQAAQYSGIAEDMKKPQTGGFITAILPPEADSISISNREDLEQIGKDPGYPLDGKYHLTSDIDLEGEEWTPIGDNATNSYDSRFRGVFDGQGHVIRNLTITGERQYSGLFGYVSDAVIKNIGLEGTNINVTFASDLYAGGFAPLERAGSPSIIVTIPDPFQVLYMSPPVTNQRSLLWAE